MDLLADASLMNEEAVIIEKDVSVPKPVRKMCFKLTSETDLVFLSEVQVCRAHIAGWGVKDKLFSKVLERFAMSHQVTAMYLSWNMMLTPKPLKDRTAHLLSERKSFVARMERASSVEEEYDKHAQTLDVMLYQIKKMKEKVKPEKIEKFMVVQKLSLGGEATHEKAMRRSGIRK